MHGLKASTGGVIAARVAITPPSLEGEASNQLSFIF